MKTIRNKLFIAIVGLTFANCNNSVVVDKNEKDSISKKENSIKVMLEIIK